MSAYQQGRDARLAGAARHENPFHSRSLHWAEWDKGWLDEDRARYNHTIK